MRRPLVLLAFGALLSGCPGALANPERFLVATDAGMDGGMLCGDVEKTILLPSCGGAGSCHENPGAASNLDLVGAGIPARIRAQTSTCQSKSMTAFILEKVKPSPSCGGPMPLAADPLSDFAISCLEKYLADVVDGGI